MKNLLGGAMKSKFVKGALIVGGVVTVIVIVLKAIGARQNDEQDSDIVEFETSDPQS